MAPYFQSGFQKAHRDYRTMSVFHVHNNLMARDKSMVFINHILRTFIKASHPSDAHGLVHRTVMFGGPPHLSGGRPKWPNGVDRSHCWLCNLLTCCDECHFCIGYTLCIYDQNEGQLVDTSPCLRSLSSLYPINVTWSRNSQTSTPSVSC